MPQMTYASSSDGSDNESVIAPPKKTHAKPTRTSRKDAVDLASDSDAPVAAAASDAEDDDEEEYIVEHILDHKFKDKVSLLSRLYFRRRGGSTNTPLRVSA